MMPRSLSLPETIRAARGRLWFACLFGIGLWAFAGAQTMPRPDIVIRIAKHRMGADMFVVSAVAPGYPVDLLRRQVQRLGELGGTPVRGLGVGPVDLSGDPKLAFTKATFATNGFIDQKNHILRLEPIAKAFAGAPSPYTVHGIAVTFNGEAVGAATLRSFASDAVKVEATFNRNPPVVDYRIQLLTQTPEAIHIPDRAQAEQKAAADASSVRGGWDWRLWIILIAAAGAAALLVYYFTLRATARPRR